MTTFVFDAARPDGGRIRGRIDAATRPEAAALLSRRGLLPLAVERADDAVPLHRARIPARQLGTALESLATLVEAGVPLAKALVATRQIVRGRLGESLERVESRVREGTELSAAMLAEPGVFPAVTIGLVRAGERGVGLAGALAQAAAQLEGRAETTGRIHAALTYPLVLSAVGGLSMLVIVIGIVPRFAALLADARGTLPIATRWLLNVSALVRTHFLGLATGVAVAGLLGWHLVTSRRARWHAWLLRLPVIGPLRHGLLAARVARTVGALLGSGTPALTALRVAAETVGDAELARRLWLVRDAVTEGAGLSAALTAHAALTPLSLQLAAIGDRSGCLPALLERAATMEERLAERRVRALVALLEPTLILLFAAIVAFVAAALLQAVYSVRPGGA